MYDFHNCGDVVLQLGQSGLTFAITNKPTLKFAGADATVKPWTRIVASFFVSIGLWSMPLLTHATNSGPDLVAQTNRVRSEHGVAVLTNNILLEKAAIAKAQDMLAQQYFAHTSPAGKTPWSFITSAGYRFTSAAENLALEPSASADPTAAWLSSSAHRQNILDPKFRDIGVAIVSGTFEGKPTTFIVQLFGSRRATVLTTSTTSTVATSPAVKPVAGKPTPVQPTTGEISVPPLMPLPAEPVTPEPSTPSPLDTAQVLGAVTQVIPSPTSPKTLTPELDRTITALVVQVIGIYFLVIATFGILQVTLIRQKNSPPLAAEPLSV